MVDMDDFLPALEAAFRSARIPMRGAPAITQEAAAVPAEQQPFDEGRERSAASQ